MDFTDHWLIAGDGIPFAYEKLVQPQLLRLNRGALPIPHVYEATFISEGFGISTPGPINVTSP